MKIIKILKNIFIFSVLVVPYKILLAGSTDINFKNPLGETSTIPALIAKVLDFVVQLGTMVAIFFVIYAGFLFVTARGKPDEITKAKTTLLWTLIGALVLIGAQVLSEVICNTAVELGAKSNCGS
jgi:hypothetical protein